MSEKRPENKQKNKLPLFGIPAILPFFKPYKAYFAAIIGCMGINSVFDAILPLFQNYAINHYVGDGVLDTVPRFTVLYLTVVLLSACCAGVGCFAAAKLEVLIDRDVRQICFDHVQTLGISYFNQNSVGYIHSRVIQDPNKVGIIASWVLVDSVADLSYIIAIFAIMFRLNPRLGLLLLCVVPLQVLITWFFEEKLQIQNHKVRELNGIITGNFNEGITGARTIKVLTAEKQILSDFTKDTFSMRAASVVAARMRALFNTGILFISGFALALVLWRGGLLTVKGLILVGELSVFMTYATSMGTYIRELVGTFANLISCEVNIERIDQLLHTESTVTDTPEVIAKYGDSFAPKEENWEPMEGNVTFDDVTFHYPDGEENVLEHFSLRLSRGNMVAIVGETGAGKSTLVNLVCRFYEPTEGRVLIDGRDVRDRSQLWLHRHIGYVLQTPHLFSGTVRENLLYGRPDATEEQMWQVLKRVGADKVVQRMENSLDSQVGEGGDRLSTGEKQLLSFARALLADPQILVLDEATSSVDTLTENHIQDAISEVTAGRTSFVIAHRLSTIRNADIILAMKDGKIVERGTHASLMQTKGYYYRLYTRQFAQDELRRAGVNDNDLLTGEN